MAAETAMHPTQQASPAGRTARRRPAWLVPAVWIAVTAVVALAPYLGLSQFGVRQLTLIAILALTVSGLNLSFGYAGELALGQAAVYAAGAYTAAYVATEIVNDVLVVLVFAALAALVVGLLSGVPGLRLGGWMLAITSFFLVLLVPSIVNAFGDRLGGFSGFTGIPLPAIAGRDLTTNGFFVLVVLVTSAWFVVFRNLVTSIHGPAFKALKTSPALAESLGVPIYQMKLRAYALGAVPAGLAGAFFAYLDGYIAPESFSLHLAIAILAASVLGGSTSVYGVFVGAAILQLGPLQSTAFQEWALVAYGVLLVLGGVLLSQGLAGYARRLVRVVLRARRGPGPVDAHRRSAPGPLEPIAGATLAVAGVSKRFGGLQALQDVSFTAEPGRVTALIGPNGSGKTTLLNVVSGLYAADEGSVTLSGEQLTGLPPHRISQAGVGRTFQTPLIPEEVTVHEAVTTGRYAGSRTSTLAAVLRTPGANRRAAEDARTTTAVLGSLGLGHLADEDASSLALGTRRVLELARLLVGGKSLVLLDEVASGLDEDEIDELVTTIGRLRDAGATVLLVEHNFELVKSLADHVVVLANGQVIAQGTPREIAEHPRVRAEYLGEGAEIAGTRRVTAGSGEGTAS